jgi:hypothetical protein
VVDRSGNLAAFWQQGGGMSNRTRGLILLAAGALLALVALGADGLGLGAHPGVGWKQLVGMAVGIVVAVAGVRDMRR